MNRYRIFSLLLLPLLAGMLPAQAGRLQFRPAGVMETGPDPYGITAADLNGDGKLELISADYTGGTVTIGGAGRGGFINLKGQYFDDRGFRGKSQTRNDSAVNFDFGNGGPLPGFGGDQFSVRWTGTLEAPADGEYEFITETDDGVRLWVNNQKIIDHWRDMAPTRKSGKLRLRKGQRVGLRMDYYENGGGAVARLFWKPPEARECLIPLAGSFRAFAEQEAGLGPIAVRAVDYNGDGKLDLAVANYNVYGTRTLLENDGAGGLRPGPVLSVGGDPREIAAADFNGDGKLDLAVANRSSRDVTVLLNTGAGFQASSLPELKHRPADLATGDFNGDGIADLAVAHGPQVALYRGTKSGSGLETAAERSMGAAVRALAAAGDRLVVDTGRELRIYRQTELAGEPVQKLAAPAALDALLYTDLNGDRRPDLAAVSSTAGKLYLFAAGARGLLAPREHTTEPGAEEILAADLDGNRRPELILLHPRLSRATLCGLSGSAAGHRGAMFAGRRQL